MCMLWTHSLSSSSVISLSRFLGRLIDGLNSKLKETFQWMLVRRRFSTQWPLIHDILLQTWPQHPSSWPICRIPGPYACPFSSESGSAQTDRQTNYVKTITPALSCHVVLAYTLTCKDNEMNRGALNWQMTVSISESILFHIPFLTTPI